MSKWREPTDQEKLQMFMAKQQQVDVQPQYYRAGMPGDEIFVFSRSTDVVRSSSFGSYFALFCLSIRLSDTQRTLVGSLLAWSLAPSTSLTCLSHLDLVVLVAMVVPVCHIVSHIYCSHLFCLVILLLIVFFFFFFFISFHADSLANFCANCGTKKGATVKFCPECGTKC
jgi:hypothetical protein